MSNQAFTILREVPTIEGTSWAASLVRLDDGQVIMNLFAPTWEEAERRILNLHPDVIRMSFPHGMELVPPPKDWTSRVQQR